jgi:hypothetical protein
MPPAFVVTSSLLFGVKAARKRPELREIGWQRTVPFVINLASSPRYLCCYIFKQVL